MFHEFGRNDEPRGAKFREVETAGRDVIVVQAKWGRLGMYLMGQAFYSPQLMMKFNPRTITSVALCEYHDAVMVPLIESYPNMKVVIFPGTGSSGQPMGPRADV
ncbi:MAG: hypothetical protein JNL58_31900 [Planctomyces sp.]|nr:hypothetical protein [Planctomyces sp.]